MSDSLEIGHRNGRLHPTAEAVYRYIIRYKRQHAGESPTRREIGEGVGLMAVSTVHYHLVTLQREGMIRLTGSKSRMIEIPGARWVAPDVCEQ